MQAKQRSRLQLPSKREELQEYRAFDYPTKWCEGNLLGYAGSAGYLPMTGETDLFTCNFLMQPGI